MIRNFKVGSILLGMSILVGCSAFSTQPNLAPPISGTIALLPIQTDSDLQREKLVTLHQTITQELRANGYSILGSPDVLRICADVSDCSPLLAIKFGVKDILSIKLDASHSVGFLGSYYNSLSGNISLSDPAGNSISAFSVSESEKGGVLFNTGQVLEALKFSGSDTADAFSQLSAKFATAVAAGLPKAASPDSKEARQSIQISDTHVTPIKESQYKVCAQGSKHAIAKLAVATNQYPLREGTPGNYCAVIPSLALVPNEPQKNPEKQIVEPRLIARIVLTSPFGDSTQKDIDIAGFSSCAADQLLIRKTQSPGAEVLLSCMDKEAKHDANCNRLLAQCAKTIFIIFDSASATDPYEKIGTISAKKTSLNAKKPTIVALSVSPDGATSIPVEIK